MRLSEIRTSFRRGREERPRLLSRGERVFAWSYTLLASLLAPVGLVLLIVGSGAAHGVGIVLVVLGLLTMVVPISPLIRARARRREARADRQH